MASIAFAIACSIIASSARAQCYSLFDEKNVLVLQSQHSPVDLAKSLSEEVERIFPKHYLLISELSPCVEVDELTARKWPIKLPAEPMNRGPIVLHSATDESLSPYLNSGGSNGRSSARHSTRSSSASTSPGTDVYVNSYRRSDGTYVRAHTRSRAR
jgi:hypothetical protein